MLSTAVISGFSNFIAKYSVTVLKDPVFFTTLKNVIVAVLVGGIALLIVKKNSLRALSGKQWFLLSLIGVVGGSIPFILFFTGLSLTSAASASFIHKSLFIWVAMLAVPFLKERFSWIQGMAFFLLIGGNLALLGTQTFTLGRGELLIFCATILWAIENVIAKHALKEIPSTIVAGSRMTFGSLILLAVVAMQGNLGLVVHLTATQWLWTIIPSVLLVGYVLTWYAALKRTAATVATSLLVPASLITSALTVAFQGKSFSQQELIAGVLFIIAIALLFLPKRKAAQGYAQTDNLA